MAKGDLWIPKQWKQDLVGTVSDLATEKTRIATIEREMRQQEADIERKRNYEHAVIEQDRRRYYR